MQHSPFTLGLIQMRCFSDKEKSLAHALDMLHQAAKQGVQVACLPELFLTHYFCQTEDPAVFDLAEPIPGPASHALSEAAKETGMVIIGSLFERRAAGVYHNTATVHEADGTLSGIYRKMHIPDDPLYYEKYYFTPGDLGFKTFHTSAGRIGTLVCWDQWYPEGARLTAMQGADVLCYPTAIGWHPSEKAEWEEAQVEQWITIQRSHAIANGVYVAACNRVGHEASPPSPPLAGGLEDRVPPLAGGLKTEVPPLAGGFRGEFTGGIEFFGNSFIADPYGRFLARASHNREEILTAVIDPAQVEEKRRHWPFFRDRRIDAYGGITERWTR